MNKLYIIKWCLKHGDEMLTISRSSWWNRQGMLDKMDLNPEWSYRLEENTEAHEVWIAY